MHLLGESGMGLERVDDVDVTLVPGRTRHLQQNRFDVLGGLVEAVEDRQGVEEPPPRAQVTEHRDRAEGPVPESVKDLGAYRVVERDPGVTKVVASTKSNGTGVSRRPERVPRKELVELVEEEVGHRHRIVEAVWHVVGVDARVAAMRDDAFEDCAPHASSSFHDEPNFVQTSTALRTPSSWKP